MSQQAKAPRVSVVLPTYNRATVLMRSVQSVLSQSFSDLELIVVDDASSDQTAEVLEVFRDPRLKIIKLEKNVGGASARNIGLEHATAELIAFQDSDDEWLPQKLEKLILALELHPDWAGIFSLFWRVEGSVAKIGPALAKLAETENMHAQLLRSNFVDTPTSLVKKDKLLAIGGFDNELPRFQDWDLFMRLTRSSTLGVLLEPLILSYVTEGSISTNSSAEIAALERIFAKNSSEIEADRVLLSHWHYTFGDAYVRKGEYLKGVRSFTKAISIDPLNYSLYRNCRRSFFRISK